MNEPNQRRVARARSLFVTKYNGMRWVEGVSEFPVLISRGLSLAAKRPTVISEIAGRFALNQIIDAYMMLASDPHGKVLVLPGR